MEELANQKVLDNVPVHALKMNRAEAEEKYRKAPVNGASSSAQHVMADREEGLTCRW